MYRLFFIGLVVLVFSGCGKKGSDLDTQFVEGIVTFDGVPTEGVYINFIPKMEGVGETANGVSNAKGRYVLSSLRGDPGKGVLEGEYFVTAAKSEIVELDKPKMNAVGDPVTSESRPVVPLLYNGTKTTPLSAVVVKGKNKIDIELKSKP